MCSPTGTEETLVGLTELVLSRSDVPLCYKFGLMSFVNVIVKSVYYGVVHYWRGSARHVIYDASIHYCVTCDAQSFELYTTALDLTRHTLYASDPAVRAWL
eukprot:SAG31_NODE_2239_length_6115_cov_2.178191_4_plen_101_part_00